MRVSLRDDPVWSGVRETKRLVVGCLVVVHVGCRCGPDQTLACRFVPPLQNHWNARPLRSGFSSRSLVCSLLLLRPGACNLRVVSGWMRPEHHNECSGATDRTTQVAAALRCTDLAVDRCGVHQSRRYCREIGASLWDRSRLQVSASHHLARRGPGQYLNGRRSLQLVLLR